MFNFEGMSYLLENGHLSGVPSGGNKKTRNPLKQRVPSFGADSQIRTGDLILTKDALYRLSYISRVAFRQQVDDTTVFPKLQPLF